MAITGYHYTTDPMNDDTLGYRSYAIGSDIVGYNGFIFPPALQSKVTVVPEYSEDQRTVKWLTIALSIEFIATDPGITQQDIADISKETEVDTSADTFISNLIRRLSQPCCALEFRAQGFGDFNVNVQGELKDLDFGPKPQVIEWEPLGGGNAARIEWLCVTRINPCLQQLTSQSILQFQYAVDWNIDSAGFMMRNVEGTVEIPLTRNSQNSSDTAFDLINLPQISNANTGGLYNAVVRDLIFTPFPLLPGFKRQYSYRLRASKKIIDFKIEDVEIRSNSRFFPGIADVEIFQNLTSSIDEGWGYYWKLTFTGRIECINGKPPATIEQSKKLAWLWLAKIIQQKRKKIEAQLPDSQKRKQKELEEGISDETALYKSLSEEDINNHKAAIYPTYVSVTDSLYGNTILFTINFAITLVSDLINTAVGLFEPVGTDIGLAHDDWTKYIVRVKGHDERIAPYPKSDYIVDVCHPPRAFKTEVPRDSLSNVRVASSPVIAPLTVDKEKNWINYTNVITYYTKNGTVLGRRVTEKNLVTVDEVPQFKDTGTRLETEMANVPFEAGVQYSESEISDIKRRISIYKPSEDIAYVIMTGNAARYGGSINPPKLIGVGEGITVNKQTGEVTVVPGKGGAVASRVDNDLATHSTERTGWTDSKGKEIVIYKCSWHRKYVLDRVPTSGKVVTSGNPRRFD